MKTIIKYFIIAIRSYKSLFLKSLIYIVLISTINILLPYGMKFFLDFVSINEEIYIIILGLVLYIVVLFINTIFTIQWYTTLDDFGGQYIKDTLVKIEKSLSCASMDEIAEISISKIRHIIFNDLLDLFRVVGHHLPSLLGACSIILFTTVLCAYYNYIITVFIVVSFMLGICISFWSRKIISRASKNTNHSLKSVNTSTNEFIDQIHTIQTNNVLPHFISNTTNAIDEFIKTAKQEDRIINFFTGLINNYNLFFKTSLSIFLALPMVNNSIVNLVFFTMLANTIMSEGQKIEQLIQQILRSQISFENIEKLLNLIPRQHNSLILKDINDIVISNMFFSYKKDSVKIFENVNFEILKGDCVRLIGANGCGKSTLIQLLMGLYYPTNGTIKINNYKLCEFDKNSLNQQILYVGQEEKIINTSLRNYFKIISDTNVENCLIDRYLECLNLENKELIIENNGENLSLGQRKKILIIKMMLRIKKASLIILDEVDSGLDAETKKLLYQLIDYYSKMKNKIILIVSHDEALNNEMFNKQLVINTKEIQVSSICKRICN